MRNIKKRILTDDAHRPVAIQIDYTDWLEIVRALNLEEKEARETDLSVHQAVIALTEDPLGYQQRIRQEWS